MAEASRRERCEVWTADLGLLRPEHETLLDEGEQARAAGYARADDRARFVLGAALLKAAAAGAAGLSPTDIRIDRTCDQCGRQHGRPRVRGLDLHVSVAHSGSMVVAALTRLGEVGVDVEERTGAADPALVRRVLVPSEPLDAERDFLTYWCRKESVLKATGEGLRVPLTEVVVTPPGRPPSVVSYRGTGLPAAMFDLDVGDPAYAAAVTVLTAQPCELNVDRADRLLSG